MEVVHYRGCCIRVEADKSRDGQWIARGVVTGPTFAATLPPLPPFPTEAAALETMTAAGLRCVDEQRERDEEGSGPTLNGGRT
jgi:hypothetical protein